MPVETLIDDGVVLRLWLSDLDAVKLVAGLLVTATTVVMVRGVHATFADDLMTLPTHTEAFQQQREGDASSVGSRAVGVGSGRCKA